MKLEVDFPVITEGLAVRSRSKKPVVARQTLKVDIPEYSAAEAPVAMVCTREWNDDPRLSENVFRAVNGQLYVRARHVTVEEGRIQHRHSISGGAQSYDVHSALDSKVSYLLATLKDKHSTGIGSAVIPGQLGEAYFTHGANLPDGQIEIPRLEDLQLREFDEAAVEDQVASFERHMVRFAMIDGKMQISEREPIYVVTMPDAHQRATIYSVSPPFGKHADEDFHISSAAMMFRADTTLEEMSREIHQVSQVIGDLEPREVGASGRVHVYDEHHLSFDAEAANMRLVARNALKGFIAASAKHLMPFKYDKLTEFLLSLPTEDFLAYRELERAMQENNPDAIAEMLPHFARFQPGVGGRGSHCQSEVMIERVLENWANRTVPELVVRNLLQTP